MQTCKKIVPEAPYKASVAKITKAEVDIMPCFQYVNTGVAEADLMQFDMWLMETRQKPNVYSTAWNRGTLFSYDAHINQEMIPIDWRVYLTWSNTFRFRYKAILDELCIKSWNNFIGPDAELRVARHMQLTGARPKPLSECDLSA